MARILIVDDREQDRYLLQTLLQGVGHQVDAAGDGIEALEAARRNPPDLAASDILMPRMDGFALCHAWRQDARLKDIPFIFYTATYTGSDDERFARSIGADRFLAKPLDPTALLAEIQLVLSEQAEGKLAGRRPRPLDEEAFREGRDTTIGRKLEQKMAQLKNSQQRIIETEAKFRALVDLSPTGIYIVDQEGRFSYVNPRLAEIFGYTVAELRGRSAYDVVAEEDRPLVREQIRRRLTGEVHEVRYEFRGRRKDGARVSVGIHGAATYLSGKPVIIGMLEDITATAQARDRLEAQLARLEQTIAGTIDIVSRIIELRDPSTAGHERRVGHLAAAIGREMGLSEDAVKGLHFGGLVHDVGIVAVPTGLLAKPAPLTPAEFEVVKTHTGHGGEILSPVDFPWPVARIAMQHHERLDGSGYPEGLRGEAICPEARIIAIADVVEAMCSPRPYRPAPGLEAALAEIEAGLGRRYDADAGAACLRLFRERGYALPG